MKLVKAIHRRCGDYDGVTFVLAPDDWSRDTIDDKVSCAQDDYLEALKIVAENPPIPRPPFHAPYEQHPDELVSEVARRHAEAKAVYAEWEKRQSRTRRGFESYLADQGFKSLYQDDVSTEVEVDWGHRHGTPIDYSTTLTDGFPTPAKLAKAAAPSDPLDFG